MGSVTTPHFHKCQGEQMKKAKNSQGFGKAMIIENLFSDMDFRHYYLQNQRFFKYIGQSILLFCLSVCLSPTGHNSKPIVMKLYQVVEVVSTEKPIYFEVKGHLEVKFLK